MLSCLLSPTSGDALIDGHSVTREPLAVKNVIGVVPQELALYETLTARQNLVFWGQMYGMSGGALKQRIDEVLHQVGLYERAKERVNQYSGGMKRRLNIAVGLLHKPKLVFMDEPTVGIDPQSRRRILDMVTELRDQGMTVIYTTHYMEEAEELSDRVGIIDQGELIAVGTQSELTRTVGQQETLRLDLGDQVLNGALSERLAAVDGVLQASMADDGLVLNVTDASAVVADVITTVSDAGLRVRAIDIREPNLEAVFLHLTGRALRD
jgi:ABC-2 type transport system ATP-binding protein